MPELILKSSISVLTSLACCIVLGPFSSARVSFWIALGRLAESPYRDLLAFYFYSSSLVVWGFAVAKLMSFEFCSAVRRSSLMEVVLSNPSFAVSFFSVDS